LNPKNLVINLLFLFGTILLCVLVFAAYFFREAKIYFRTHQTYYTGDSFIEEDPQIGFRQRPNIKMQHIAPPVYTVYSDDLGLRVEKEGLQSPSTVDLLAVGCSFTWGHGVEDPATYIKVLGRKENLRVANAALASFGTTAALLSLDRFAHLRPKVVIYGFIEDHISRSLEPCAPTLSPYCRSIAFVDFTAEGAPFIHAPEFISSEYYSYTRDVGMDHRFGFKDVYWTIRRSLLTLTKKDGWSINKRFRKNMTPERREKALRFLIDQMVAKTRAMKAKLIIAYLPLVTEIRPPPPELDKALEGHLDQHDVFFVDVAPAMAAAEKRFGVTKFKAGGVDGHPSEAAHEIIAESIAPVLDLALEQNRAATGSVGRR
jgi:hypothetical protein